MKSLYLNLLVVIFVAVSCGEKKESESKTDALFKKVMAVHDEVMPKMSDIMNLKKQINTKIEELTAAGSEENAATIAELKKALEDLDNSNAGMMSWMREFDRNFEGKVEEEVFDYLNDQMTKIENVSKAMNSAIKNAEEILSE